jgi:hypothetical protein
MPFTFLQPGRLRIGLRAAICERSTLVFAKRLGLLSASRPESYELDRQVNGLVELDQWAVAAALNRPNDHPQARLS